MAKNTTKIGRRINVRNGSSQKTAGRLIMAAAETVKKATLGGVTSPKAVERGQAMVAAGSSQVSRSRAMDALVAKSRGQSAGLALVGKTSKVDASGNDTYQRTYRTGPKAGTTETVRKKD